MQEIKKEIKSGITVHLLPNNQFKTNLLSIFITTPMNKQNVTYNALIPAVLMQGSKNYQTYDKISKKLEDMYGASFDGGVEKNGDNQVLKFYLESIASQYLMENVDLLEESIDLLCEIVFNPYIENGKFKDEYVKIEKDRLKHRIEGKGDNKASYAYTRCIEEMYKDKPFGIYKFGYVEDLEKIDSKNLYEKYKETIGTSKIDIFVSGEINDSDINKIEEKLKIINERDAKFIVTDVEEQENIKEPKYVEEVQDIAQAKLVMGLNVCANKKDDKYISLVYNAILGGIPTSKLFQNVREKESLAYTASSSYLRQKNNIFIRCGVETENYEKARDIIFEQLENMKKGDFSEEDIQSAKRNIISAVKCIPDEQDMVIIYYFGQELSNIKMDYNEYIDRIESVSKEQIVDLAKKVNVHTIYLLKGGKESGNN